VESLKAGAIACGEMLPSRRFVVEPPVDVKVVCETGLSQREFAQVLRVSVKALQNWEPHRRAPSDPAAVLLTLAARAPKMVLETLHA